MAFDTTFVEREMIPKIVVQRLSSVCDTGCALPALQNMLSVQSATRVTYPVVNGQ